MVLSFQLTEDEYFEYSYYIGWKAPWNKNKRLMYYVRTTVILCAAIVAVILVNKTESPETNMISVFFVLVVCVPLLILLMKEKYRRMAKKVYNDPNNKQMFSNRELSLNETGIVGKDEFSEFQFKWSGITKRRTTENLYILFLTDITGLVIPRRIFKTESEMKTFEQMLAQYVPLQADLPVVNE